jgi:anti-sigma-K factor RskA
MVAEQRIEFIENAPDIIQWRWQTTDDYAGDRVDGDIVWSDSKQQGYMRLSGLQANDPAISQYQLWIIDTSRDRNPVDGGVFDVPPGVDEAIIPIDAKLRVSSPAAFAVTSEQPGGVVVSGGPLLIIAAVNS